MLSSDDTAHLRQIIREEFRAALADNEALKRGIPVGPNDVGTGDHVRVQYGDGTVTYQLLVRDERGWWSGLIVETTGAYTLPSVGYPEGATRDVPFFDTKLVRRAG